MATTRHSHPEGDHVHLVDHDHSHGDHGHSHGHGQAIPLRAEGAPEMAMVHNLGPTYDSTVVMEVGGDTGGLVVYTDADHLGIEVDIFERGRATPLTHTAIRERHLGNGVRYAGVYPGLQAGEYTVAAIGSHPATDVTVVGGRVVEIHTERLDAAPQEDRT